jgi:hypothetical protein
MGKWMNAFKISSRKTFAGSGHFVEVEVERIVVLTFTLEK